MANIGVKDFSLEYSLNGAQYFSLVSTTQLPVGYGNGTPVEAFVLTLPQVEAQYVRMNIQTNWGNALFTGLSEVMFSTVPEPGALTLLGAASGMLLRRRQRQAR